MTTKGEKLRRKRDQVLKYRRIMTKLMGELESKVKSKKNRKGKRK